MGSLPFAGDLLDQPYFVVQVIRHAEDTRIGLIHEHHERERRAIEIKRKEQAAREKVMRATRGR